MAKLQRDGIQWTLNVYNYTDEEELMDIQQLWAGNGKTKESFMIVHYSNLLKSTDWVVIQHLGEVEAGLTKSISDANFKKLMENRVEWESRRANYLPDEE